jgi:drug/metabolite transporter (DMT)-like permease
VRGSLAVIFALGAAALYGLGNALEHRVVSETEAASGAEPGLLRRLVRRPLWVVGMVGDIGAYGLQAAALAFGTLLVVQPLLACGLLVALPLSARWTGRTIQRREWIAALVLCVSLATFLIEASPGGGTAHAPVARWLRDGGIVVLLIVLAVALASRARGNVRAALLGFAAGGLFGITAALTKTFVDQIQHGVPYTASHWEVYALAALSITGILFTQHGFQHASLSASLPALEATEPVVAAIMGITLLHEHIDGRTTFDGVVIGVAIFAALTCVLFLATVAGHDADRSETATIPRSAVPRDPWAPVATLVTQGSPPVLERGSRDRAPRPRRRVARR